MRALGIEISGSDSLLVILNGTAKNCIIEFPSPSRLRLPTVGGDVETLIALKKQVYEILNSERVSCVGVIRADRNSSPIRAKVECMIQIASSEASICCMLLPAQTIAAADKRKVNAVAGSETEKALHQISPAYLRKAVHCAWSVLYAREQ
jgi:hypothetical protein